MTLQTSAQEEGQIVVDIVARVMEAITAVPTGERETMQATLAAFSNDELLRFSASVGVLRIVYVLISSELARRPAADVEAATEVLKAESKLRRAQHKTTGLYGG